MDNSTRWGGVGGWADHPMLVDALLAVVVVAVELVNLQREITVAGYDPPLPDAAVAAWLVAMGLLLVWRRQRPLVVVAVVGVAAGIYGVIDLPTLNLPLLVVVFTAGLMLRPVLVGTALAVGVGAVNLLRGSLSQLPIDLVVFGAVWLLGVHLRVRQEHARDLQRRREAELWRARSRERIRLARDLHDIVSNGVGGIYLQAVGAAGLLDEDPQRARSALDTIQLSARSTLDELRTLLEVLRQDPEGQAHEATERGATPSLADLDQLLDRTRAAGATVLVEVEGDLHGLPAGVSTTGYRTVQEALGNALRHGADEPVVLRISATEGLRIEVTNTLAAGPGHGQGSGWGLTGMRERVRALGGHLDTRTGDGRFHLTAHLPHRETGG